MRAKNSLEKLRAKDYDRYIATKFLPKECHENLSKWYLWWHSVVGVVKPSDDPMPQIIRLQWWIEQLDDSTKLKPDQEFYDLISLFRLKNISTKPLILALEAEQNWLEIPENQRSLAQMENWLCEREKLVFSIAQQIFSTEKPNFIAANEQKKLNHLFTAYGLVQYVRSGMSFSLPIEWSQESWSSAWLSCVESHWNEGKSMLTHPLLVHMALIPTYQKRLIKSLISKQKLASAPILRLLKIWQQMHKIEK